MERFIDTFNRKHNPDYYYGKNTQKKKTEKKKNDRKRLSDSGWADEKQFTKMKVAAPVNEGWIFSKDRNFVKVFASYDKEDDGTLTFGDRTMIPMACVKKITKLN